MWKTGTLFAFLLFWAPASAQALNLISTASWSESGDYKMPRQDNLPFREGAFCSTCTVSRTWDGTTIKLFGGKGELLTWVTYLVAGPSADATNVFVKISSFTGTGAAAGTGFSAVVRSSGAVWDFTQTPYALYKYGYVKVAGLSNLGNAFDISEYDENQLPPRFRVPCTGTAPCSPTGGTQLWSNRQDNYKFYPDAAIPMEVFTSSFTIGASSSQAIGGEVYISTSLIANATYTFTLSVYEGATLSTSVPGILYVYNTTLPGVATLPVTAWVSETDLAMRLNANRFPGDYYVDPYLTSGLRAAAFLHRHKIIAVGDSPADTTKDYPSVGYQKHIDGSAYKETYGLSPNTSPGYGMGDKIHWIGVYGSWVTANWVTSQSEGGSTSFCVNASSWAAYCASNGLNCQLYTSDDENAHGTLTTTVETNATWLSTSPFCANNGNRISYLQTETLPTIYPLAPNVTTVLSGGWLAASSATWVSEEAEYNKVNSTHAAGGYNSTVGVDGLFDIAEEGLGPREVMAGAWKTGQKYWFLWAITGWQDQGNGGQGSLNPSWNGNANNDDDIYNVAKTFGYDIFPTTSSIKGHTGASFSNGNGTMLYYGTDAVYANPNYRINAVFGSWRLNQLTRGIQDVDIITQAYAVNPSSTTALVNNLVQDVTYLRQCANLGDCTYSYGPRPWSEGLNNWETTREALYQIISTQVPLKGTISGKGNSFQGAYSFSH